MLHDPKRKIAQPQYRQNHNQASIREREGGGKGERDQNLDPDQSSGWDSSIIEVGPLGRGHQ